MSKTSNRNGSAAKGTNAATGGRPQPGGERPVAGEDDTGLRLPKVISFSSLATCGDEIWIENNGQLYRLRRTNQGKLILTK